MTWSQDRAQAMVEGAPDAIVVIDRSGTVTAANAAADRLFVRDRDDLLGCHYKTLLAEGFEEHVRHAFESVDHGPGPHQVGSDLEVFGRTGEGVAFPVEINFNVLPGSGGAELVAAVRDVSHRHRSEAALREALSLLTATLESTADGILVVSAEGQVAGSNSRFVEMWGIPEDLMASGDDDQLMGFVLDQLVDPGAFVAKVMDLYRRPEEESNDVLEFRDGRTFERYSRPQRVGDRTVGRVWSFRDVTPRVWAQREAEEARAAALQASRAKSDFLATMSHEIRTPMNGVIGLTGLLLQTSLDEEQQRYAAGVRGAGEALLGIVDDILDFSKLEAGKVQLESVPFSPRSLVEEVGVLFADSAAGQELEFIVHCDPDVPAATLGDPGRLRQALINLTGNAVKFTPAGSVVVTVAVDGGTLPPAGKPVPLRFAVRDTGIGIDEATVARLFQPFSQADASTTRRFGGTGLGLAISSRLVTAMGGELGVESQPGVGSTFAFTIALPVASSAPASRATHHVAERPTASTRAHQGAEPLGRVLVAEDNPVNQLVALGILENLGYRGELAADGHEVLRALATQRFDVVLMDCHMPGIDGFEATRMLRAAEGPDRHTPVVAMTAGVLDEDRERCLAAGMDDFVAKPIDVDHLRRTLERWTTAAPAPAALDGERIALLRRLGKADGWGMLPDVARTFLADVEGRRAAIEAALAAGDAGQVHELVHGLKGAAGNIGAVGLMEACRAMEQVCATGTVPGDHDLAVLMEALAGACAELERLVAEVR